MSTKAQLIFYSPHTSKQAKKISQKIFQRLQQLNRTFSHYLLNSETNQISLQPINQPIKVSTDMLTLLLYAKKIWQQTNHYFDITLTPPPPHLKAKFSSTLNKGFQYIKINQQENSVLLEKPLFLSFGAIAKGYASDEIIKILKQHQIKIASIDIGGEIALTNSIQKQGWKIWLTDANLQKTHPIYLKNTSISTSGDYYHLKKFTKSHILTSTGYSHTKNTVTVIAPTSLQADTLSTSFKAMGLKKTKQFLKIQPNIKTIFIDQANTTHYINIKK